MMVPQSSKKGALEEIHLFLEIAVSQGIIVGKTVEARLECLPSVCCELSSW